MGNDEHNRQNIANVRGSLHQLNNFGVSFEDHLTPQQMTLRTNNVSVIRAWDLIEDVEVLLLLAGSSELQQYDIVRS